MHTQAASTSWVAGKCRAALLSPRERPLALHAQLLRQVCLCDSSWHGCGCCTRSRRERASSCCFLVSARGAGQWHSSSVWVLWSLQLHLARGHLHGQGTHATAHARSDATEHTRLHSCVPKFASPGPAGSCSHLATELVVREVAALGDMRRADHPATAYHVAPECEAVCSRLQSAPTSDAAANRLTPHRIQPPVS